jgi:hypothetical protein
MIEIDGQLAVAQSHTAKWLYVGPEYPGDSPEHTSGIEAAQARFDNSIRVEVAIKLAAFDLQ